MGETWDSRTKGIIPANTPKTPQKLLAAKRFPPKIGQAKQGHLGMWECFKLKLKIMN